MRKNNFTKIEKIISAAKKGEMYILVDDENRENEGDLVVPASNITAKKINFMAKYGRGLICLSLTDKQAKKLNLSLMSPVNKSRKQTAGYRNATPYLLRWSSAIATKVKKFSDYHSAGRIKEYDACVIAVNSALLGIEGQHGFSDHPTLVDIVMPVGAPYVTIDRKTGSIKNEGLSYTPKLDKVNRLGDEVEVPKGLFYSNTSKQISAVMSSNMTCFGPSVLPSPTLVLVHNPFAATPLPKKLISCDIEIMFERRDNAFHIEYL